MLGYNPASTLTEFCLLTLFADGAYRMQNRIQFTQTFYISPAAAPFFRLFGLVLIAIAVLSLVAGFVHAINHDSWVELSSKLPGAGILACLGGGCWYFANRILRTRLAQIELFKKHPNEPWLWREDWVAKRIALNDTLPKVLLGLFVLGVVFAFYVAYRNGQIKPNEGLMNWWVVGTIAAAWMGFNIYRLNRRWRLSELEIETLPGRIGGEFRGTVWLSEPIAPSTPFRVYLSCEEMTWYRKSSPSQRGLGITTRILWNSEIEPQAGCEDAIKRKTPIPIAFSLPVGLEPTTMDEHPTSEDFDLPKGLARRIEWWLTVKPHNRNDSRSIRFCVPVFPTQTTNLQKPKRKRSS
jgi:hypothetical protein